MSADFSRFPVARSKSLSIDQERSSWLQKARTYFASWHALGDPLDFTERMTGISRDTTDGEDRGYLHKQVKEYQANYERCVAVVADIFEAHPEPERYLSALQRVVNAEGPRVSVPWDTLVTLATYVREAPAAEAIAVAAEHWQERFPALQVPGRFPGTFTFSEMGFISLLSPLTRAHDGVRPLDLYGDGLADMFPALETLYELSKLPGCTLPRTWLGEACDFAKHGALPVFALLADSLSDRHPAVSARVLDLLHSYARTHEPSKRVFKAFYEAIPVALASHNPEVDLLQRSGNVFGMKYGQSGVADFIIDCYVQPVTPTEVALRILDAESLPALDASTRAQNVRDGLALMCFGPLRDQIHDHVPGTHELIGAMIAYYEDPAHDRTNLERLSQTSPSYFRGRFDYARDSLFDLSIYDGEAGTSESQGISHKETAIQILKRVHRNTHRLFVNPPPMAEDALRRPLEVVMNQYREHGTIARGEALFIMQRVNRDLEAKMANVEAHMQPTEVRFLVWVDQLCTQVLQSYHVEDQLAALRSPLFKEMVRFHELTHHPKGYQEAEFEAWFKSLQSNASTHDDLSWQQTDALESFKKIAQRILLQLGELKNLLQARQRDHQIKLLWSGNATDQLLGLVDARPASTAIGKRKQREITEGSYFE